MPARIPTGNAPRSTRSTTGPKDLYGLGLTTSPEAAAAYNRGVRSVLNVQQGGADAIAESIAHDPTFALGHAEIGRAHV